MTEMQAPNRHVVAYDLETEHDIRDLELSGAKADEYRAARRNLTAYHVATLADATAKAAHKISEGFHGFAKEFGRLGLR